MDGVQFFLVLLGVLVFGLVMLGLPAAVAVSRGRSPLWWGIAGLVLGPLLVVVLYLLPDRLPQQPRAAN